MVICPPLGVNFKAFPIKLTITLCMASSSYMISHEGRRKRRSMVIPLSDAYASKGTSSSLSNLAKLPGLRTISIFPDSTLRKSINWLTSESRYFELRSTKCNCYIKLLNQFGFNRKLIMLD